MNGAFRTAFGFWRGMRRKFAAVGVALMLAVQVFSAAYIAHEADHDCTGHDCPICLVLHQCVNNFQLLGSGTLPAPPCVVEAPPLRISAPRAARQRNDHPTLVSLKVRLDE